MAREEGIVTHTNGASAMVRTIKSGACDACSAKGFCTDSGRDMTVTALNIVSARPGDRVRLEIATGAFMKVMFLLYIVPVMALLAGALIGLALAGDSAAAVGALIAFILAVAFVRQRGRRMGTMDAYQPRIVKIVRRRAADEPQPGGD